MPTPIPSRRTWCTSCQDFKIFKTRINGNDAEKFSSTHCTTCENEYVPYSLSEVPEEKILEQRKRYAEYKKIEFTNMLNYYQNMGASDSKYLLGPNGIQPHTNIQEDDAGQDAIWKAERARQKAIQDEAQEFKERFQGAQRNEKCRCGSNVKYKKCCLPKVNTIK
jgi:hypothetical protein